MQVLRFDRPRGGKANERMEINMTGKLTAIVAAVVVLASAGVASAQTTRQARVQWQAPYANSYITPDTRNLRYGHANDNRFDPYAGTVFEGVAPY
jgi:hypothetical protein